MTSTGKSQRRRWAWPRRPAALRGRVVVSVLALVTVLLIGLFVAVDLVLQARLRTDLRTRLDDRVALAEQLDAALSPQQLVDRLKGDGVTAQLCTPASVTGTSFRCLTGALTVARPVPNGAGNGAPGRAPKGSPAPAPKVPRAARAAATSTPIRRDGSVLYVRTTLPQSGQVLTLAVDGAEVTATIQRLVALEVTGGVLALAVAALLLGRVVAVALRPLDDMTSLAHRIAGGDRGRRLGTGRPDTELGRTATAFDGMLDELESALAAASAAQAQLRGFLSDVSHELRTPLTGLHATSELLLRDEPDAPGREKAYLAMVRETRRASRLVDDLLTVARLDSGVPLAFERTDLVEITQHEIDRVRLLAPGLRVGLVGPPSARLLGDPIRLGQIVANLLDNARHASTTGGAVTVEIGTGIGPEPLWWLDVVDSGTGVAADHRDRIFDRLVRLDASRSRHTGGFGLGLPIARALARAHGGDLTYAAGPGDIGARFRLSLPGEPVDAEPLVGGPSAQSGVLRIDSAAISR